MAKMMVVGARREVRQVCLCDRVRCDPRLGPSRGAGQRTQTAARSEKEGEACALPLGSGTGSGLWVWPLAGRPVAVPGGALGWRCPAGRRRRSRTPVGPRCAVGLGGGGYGVPNKEEGARGCGAPPGISINSRACGARSSTDHSPVKCQSPDSTARHSPQGRQSSDHRGAFPKEESDKHK